MTKRPSPAPLADTVTQLIAEHGYAYLMEAIRAASVGCAVRIKSETVALGFAGQLRDLADAIERDTANALRG